MRNTTERPEALRAGTVKLVGTSIDNITSSVGGLLTDYRLYEEMSRAHNPYGDGTASSKIVEHIETFIMKEVS